MFGPSVDEDFINSAVSRPPRRGGGSGKLLLAALVAGAAGFLLWSANFEIEEVTRGLGQVVPSSQVQVVQSLEGGIVSGINVREGDIVEAGAELIRIDDTTAGAQEGEYREREAALLAELTRVRTEAEGGDSIAFPEELLRRAPNSVAAETEVFQSRRLQYQSEIRILADKLDQRAAELEELKAVSLKLQKQIAPLSREVALTEDLAETGAVPEIEVLRLQGRLAALEGELAVTEARLKAL